MPLVVGVDSSTSSCKVEVRDLDTGALVASGRAAHPHTSPPRSEQDPASWWAAFDDASAQAGLSNTHRPAAIAVAAQQHGMVVLDANQEILRPAKLWNDTESAPDAAHLLEQLGRPAWAEACGSVPVPSFTITKLAWLRRREPHVFRQVASVLLPHDWLNLQLSGAMDTERGDASGTGYWSPNEDRWRTDLLDLVDTDVGWEQLLPKVHGPLEAVGERKGTGTLIAPGTGDNMAAALGLALEPSDLVLSLGTSATAYCVSDLPAADPSGRVAGFASADGRFLPLVCSLNATKVTDAFARLLGVDLEQFDAMALSAAPGAEGVTLVPHLDRERTPDRPGATGSLLGLHTETTREQIARAVVEGVICNLLEGADLLSNPGGSLKSGRVILIGGGARSAAFSSVAAQLTQREVLVPDEHELVALGAALQATATYSGISMRQVAPHWSLGKRARIEPEPDPGVGAPASDIRQRFSERSAQMGELV